MRDNAPMIIILTVLLGGALLLVMLSDFARDRELDNSVIGINGLSAWLKENDVAVRQSHPRLSPHIDDLSIRVLPLYDVNLLEEAGTPKTVKDLVGQQTQRDLSQENFKTKISELPTLVMLPKWTTGFIETDIAYKETLIPLPAYNRLFRQIDLPDLKLKREKAVFESASVGSGSKREVALFHAQSFAPGTWPNTCQVHQKMNEDVIALACRFDETAHVTYIFSDPDLLNNHGLSVAENAAFAKDFMIELVLGNEKPIYVDTSHQLLTQYEPNQEERRDYERSGSDLARFFEFPLSLLWAAALSVLAIVYWRGAIRFGPLEREPSATANHSKTVAIATKARLLRLSESDGQMVADFVRNQLTDLTIKTLGPDLGATGMGRYFSHISRRDAQLAYDFQTISEHLINNAHRMTHADLFKGLDTYKTLLEKVVDSNGSIGISKTR
ncbi:MAG: hypothetical protein ABJN26_26510 [Stappiaceae bacterium]